MTLTPSDLDPFSGSLMTHLERRGESFVGIVWRGGRDILFLVVVVVVR